MGVEVFNLGYVGGYIFHFNALTKPNSHVFTEEQLDLLNNSFIADSCLNDCRASKNEEKNRWKFESEKQNIKNSQNINFNLQDYSIDITNDSKISCPEYDSMVTSTPISEDKSLFYFNIKTYGLQQSCRLAINGKKYDLSEVTVEFDSGRGA